jgi:hypothetical protein
MAEEQGIDLSMESPAIGLLQGQKRERFIRYWREYLALPGMGSAEELRLQGDIAAGVMLPDESLLQPSTALAVATGLLQYHRDVGEGLAAAFDALAKLSPKHPIRPPLDAYVTYALGDLSYRFGLLSRRLIRPTEDARRGNHAHSS